jgi:hypothetical protein
MLALPSTAPAATAMAVKCARTFICRSSPCLLFLVTAAGSARVGHYISAGRSSMTSPLGRI